MAERYIARTAVREYGGAAFTVYLNGILIFFGNWKH
jgi:hypothetical protein